VKRALAFQDTPAWKRRAAASALAKNVSLWPEPSRWIVAMAAI